jgi:hydroxyacyl-ACP dehydratase HTD2-like protein with hotdog domain
VLRWEPKELSGSRENAMLKYQPVYRQCSRILFRHPQARHSSTIDFSKLAAALKERELPVIYDTLSPQPSYLLNQSLKDFLRDSPSFARAPAYKHVRLPPGHHLVYFPTPTTASQLLPDGTDTLHSPGPPFTQRLWAGGRVQFVDPDQLRLDSREAALVERIQDVRVTGEQGSEKIFVGIERRIGMCVQGQPADMIRKRMMEEAPQEDSQYPVKNVGLIERRDLCFLRSDASPLFQPGTPRKALKPPSDPTFVVSLTPTPALLFRFSALTFNAHAIHIDPEYTRNVYGLPKPLVHGPLCLTIMLECLNQTIRGSKNPVIAEIAYRNFAPVFVGEELRVCFKMKTSDGEQSSLSRKQEWEVWIETGEGENAMLAVRGTASVTARSPKVRNESNRLFSSSR